MVGNRILGDGYVFYSAGSAGSFSKINRLTLPQYIMLALLYFLNVWLELLVVSDRDGLLKFIVAVNIVKPVLLSKLSEASNLQKLPENGFLVRHRCLHRFAD